MAWGNELSPSRSDLPGAFTNKAAGTGLAATETTIYLTGTDRAWFVFGNIGDIEQPQTFVKLGSLARPGTSIGLERSNFDYNQQWSARSYPGAIIASSFGARVPEPSTCELMIVGFGLTGAAMRRRIALLAP